MKECAKVLLSGAVALFFVATLLAPDAQAAPPQTIHYQGYLTSAGAPLTGSRSVVFKLYSAPTGGTALWTETQTVNVANGNFSVLLGNVTSFASAGLAFDNQYYLGITLDTDSEMSPRQALSASPYAMRAGVADAVNANNPLVIGSNNSAPCAALNAGGLRWNSAATALEVCDGIAWKAVAVTTFNVGGSVSGLIGSVVLQNNSGNNLTVSANGSFAFSNPLPNASPYSVTVLTQPAGQTCVVSNGAGVISGANISNVTVTCASTYSIGGTVSGLSGTVVLQNNLGNNLSVSTNGSFAFSIPLSSGSAYSVTVLTQPASQTCSVTSASGTVAAANVTSVSVACVTASSGGTDFFLALPDHMCVSQPTLCGSIPVTSRLRIAAAAATSGQVTFNGVSTPFSVTAGGEAVVTLDAAAVIASNESVEAKGIRVTALAPVSVHAIVESGISSGGYLALPTSGLGTQYRVMARADTGIAGSVFAVVATQDATTVTITPSAAGATKPANTPFNVTLNAGQTYQFENPAFADLTASQVSADKPVAVFAGHACARIPGGTPYCDYLVEQMPDVTRLGRKFRTLPFSGRTRYSVRLVGIAGNTALTYVPAVAGAPTTLAAGQIGDIILTAGQEIIADHPLLVAQYMHGATDQPSNAVGGDPGMVLVTPEEQGITDAVFSVHGLGSGTGSFVNIVTPTSALATLALDGAPVNPALFAVVGASGFSGGAVPVAAGPHRLTGTAPFTAAVYGYGDPVSPSSYAYPAATSLGVLPP